MAHRFFVDNINDLVKITGEEYNHLSKVLRLKVEDKVECIHEDDYIYKGIIQEITSSYATIKIIEKIINKANPQNNVVVFQALPKGDKLDLIVQKLAEIGVSVIQPFTSRFCISKPTNKTDRYNRISKSASKQCGRSRSLIVKDCISFDKMLDMLDDYDTVIFANETEDKITDYSISDNVAIIVGSEGGFAKDEIEKIKSKAISISLGSRILRTETASIVLSAIILNRLGDL